MDLTKLTHADLTTLSKEVHKINREHGFWDDLKYCYNRFRQLLVIEKLALAHGELSEALEGLRKGDGPDSHLPAFKNFDVELADAIIRILDIAAVRQIDIAAIVAVKTKYNEERPYKHGKKF